MTLGQRIQAGRSKLGLSQEALGERLGVTRQSVSKWEADGAVPDTDKLIALSKLFGVSLNALLQVEEPGGDHSRAPANRHKRVWHTLSAFLAAALALSTVLLWMRVAELEERVAALQSAPVPAAVELDRTAPLVAAFDFSLENTGKAVELRLNLTALQVVEGMEVTFTATTHGGVSETVQGEALDGGNYTALITLAGMPEPPITVTTAFSDAAGQYVQALVKISSYGGNGYDWEPLWER